MRTIRFAVLAMLVLLLGIAEPLAQTSPPNYPASSVGFSPTFTASGSLAAAGDLYFVVQGQGSLVVTISGTNTGVAATFRGAVERSGTQNWSALAAIPVASAGGRLRSVTGNGSYRINATGYAVVNFHMTAISTGSVTVDWAGTPAQNDVLTAPNPAATYSATVTGLAPAASATDFFAITGSATATITVTKALCSGTATAATSQAVALIKRSTADTGTSGRAAITAAQHDANDAAPTAIVYTYTTNPTVGTGAGTVRNGLLTYGTLASSAFTIQPVDFLFGNDYGNEPIVLRGAAQWLAFNNNAASVPSGAALTCTFEWREEG